MALQHLRSNTASKRPTAGAMSDGQIAINTNATSPGLFFKDAGGSIIKVGPVHVGTTAPNSSPAGSTGNSLGEQWLDTSGGGYVLKIWDGSAWRSEVGEFVDAAGDTMTGDLIMNNANIVFEGSTDDGFETTLTVVDPTADRTITLPNVTGTVVTTGDTGTVTSTMIADGTIVNADVNASAAIAGTKIDPDFGSQAVTTTGQVNAARVNVTGNAAPTNGLYLPGTNQVAISTNGTGRLFIDSSGNVKIGGTSSIDTDGLSIETTATAGGLNIISPDNGRGDIFFGDASDKNIGQIRYSHVNDSFTIRTNASDRFVIDSSGRVGVGTSSPGYKLDVNGEVVFSPNTAGKNTFYFTTNASNDASLFLKSDTTDKVNIQANGTSYFNGGNVGIGTSSPLATLHTNGAILSSGALAALSASNIFFDQPTSALSRIGIVGANTSTAGTLRISQYSSNGSVGRDVFSINSSGNVGIGVTSPGAPLEVNGTVICGRTDGSAYIANRGGYSSSTVYSFWNNDTTGISNPAAGQLGFLAAGSERARIDGSGRLGIGTSSPSEKLTVAGNISLSAAQPYISLIDSVWGAGTVIRSGVNTLGTSTGDYQLFNVPTGKGFAFAQNNATNSLVIDSSGRVGIGTTSPGTYNAKLAVYSAGGAFVGALHANASGTFPKASAISLGSDAVSYTYTTGGASVALTGSAHIAALQSASSGAGTDIAFINTSNGNVSERARIDSSGRLLVGTSSDSGGALLQVNGNRIRVATAKTPASASDTGTTGEICWDASYIYVCTATNTWKRAALSTW